jgi:lipopolysaccharide/colanic/teichoic acid biosynthesis glycosyltransferase
MRSDQPYAGKRLADLVLLSLVAMPASVIGALCAIAVKVTSKGPVFFRQQRVGMDGALFSVWKFRTMSVGDNPIFPDESRITSAGRYLRRFSLDEVPQLINVAKGEMSIVGPRPTLEYQVERYDDQQRRRLAVRPGMTGLAQVRGRNSLSWAQRIAFDIEYVESQSVRTDVAIIAATVRAILSADGVEGHPTDDPLASTDP